MRISNFKVTSDIWNWGSLYSAIL